MAIFVFASIYLVVTAIEQDRDLFPKTHDDQSYAIQTQMIARGRLWMPQHPLADFFDNFYVIVRPVYASLYFPGAAMLFAPGVWLGLPTWAIPALCAGAIVGLTYRIVAELLDGWAGLLAAMLLLASSWFRMYAVLMTSHEPVLMLSLVGFVGWLNWRRENSVGWAILVGVALGWAAITRPGDALCMILPIGVAMLWQILRAPDGLSRRRAWLGAAVGVAGAAPFLAAQLTFNRGVTGHWLDTPYTFYLRQDQPNSQFGFHPWDSAARPKSIIPQKQDYYDTFFAGYAKRHQPDQLLHTWASRYLPMAIDTVLPWRFLLILFGIGLLGIRDVRRAVLVAVIPLFFAVYVLNPFFLEHYAIYILPAVAMGVLLGVEQIGKLAGRRGTFVRRLLGMGIFVLCLSRLPELTPGWTPGQTAPDETFSSDFMRLIKQQIPSASDLHRPAVILVKYSRGNSIVAEPVYNTDVAWPDDATVIYAHDLGERNIEIFRYYAEKQPGRYFYRYDRGRGLFEPLGEATTLARQGPH